jgi:hypothetical protein
MLGAGGLAAPAAQASSVPWQGRQQLDSMRATVLQRFATFAQRLMSAGPDWASQLSTVAFLRDAGDVTDHKALAAMADM